MFPVDAPTECRAARERYFVYSPHSQSRVRVRTKTLLVRRS